MTARPYSNPYLSGFGLGLVLLAAFVVMGRGLGASGAFAVRQQRLLSPRLLMRRGPTTTSLDI